MSFFWRSMITIIDWAVSVYGFLIIVRTLLSWLGPLPYNPLIQYLKRLTDPVLRLVHRFVPFAIVSGIDISPMIVLLLLYLGKNVAVRLIFHLAVA